ncbi:right-handed parallel beta-helix repeat-containing protein [Candidatus Poribacteria bacterium]|nr:right-handed parallel beta-helix repeat-containing protein [Candidatus Poribacteria bacterium]
MTGDVTVVLGGKLTVLPGTVVKCQPKTDDRQGGADKNLIELIIDGGELIASGTESERIIFTSAAENPEKGDWYGIRHLKGSLTFRYCDVSFSKIGLSVEGSVPNPVEHCSFSNSITGVGVNTSAKFVDCSFKNNSTGVWFKNIRLERCDVSGNENRGILGNGIGYFEECVITGNGEEGIRASRTVTINNCTIRKNNGEGLVISKLQWGNNTATISDSVITENAASGISVEKGELTIANCTITSNAGAGIDMSASYGKITADNCVISENGGEGINMASNDNRGNKTVNISNCEIMGNKGIGINVDSGSYANTVDIVSCKIMRNSGGGISIISSSTNAVAINNCMIEGNGGIGVNIPKGENTVTMNGSSIALNDGAGIDMGGGSNSVIRVDNCSIILNTGVGIAGHSGLVELNGCLVKGNSGSGVGGGTVSVTDSIIANNGGTGISLRSVGEKGINANQISQNNIGIEIKSSSEKLEGITGNDILNNIMYELKNSGRAEVIAADNYWGEPTTTELKNGVDNLTMIYDRHDDPNVGPVTISKYRTEPVREDTEIPPPPEPKPVTGKGRFTLRLKKGLNMISLPVKPDTPYTARSFIEKLGATVIVRYDTSSGKFIPFIPEVNEGDGFQIEGGQGYIVNVMEDKEVTFEGTVWSNAPPISAGNLPNTSWAFLIGGTLLSEDGKFASGRYTLIIRNLRTGRVSLAAVGYPGEGRFIGAFVDMSHGDVVEEGDIIEVKVIGGDGEVVAGPVRHRVTVEEVERAYGVVELCIGDVIPSRTCLLPNYPNPFNPETWIPFRLAEGGEVRIRIYDLQGRLVKELNLGRLGPGSYINKAKAAYWDGRSDQGEQVASGVYVCQMVAGEKTFVRKMVILR